MTHHKYIQLEEYVMTIRSCYPQQKKAKEKAERKKPFYGCHSIISALIGRA
jgi:hypothetical protein